MGLTQPDGMPALSCSGAEAGEGSVYRPPAHAHRRKAQQTQEKIRTGPAKPRRPDRAVYVPRARRSAEGSLIVDSDPSESRSRPNACGDSCQRVTSPSPKDKSQPGTPRKSLDRKYCNVYTPPPLRNSHKLIDAPSICDPPLDNTEIPIADSVPFGVYSQVPNTNSAIPYSDNSCKDYSVTSEHSDNSIIRADNDYVYEPTGLCNDYSAYYSDYESNIALDAESDNQCNERNSNQFVDNYAYGDYSLLANENSEFSRDWISKDANEINMAVPQFNQNIDIISNGDNIMYSNTSKDEDIEQNELIRASQEINRSNRRIIKQSFVSDVLVISDPVKEKPISQEELIDEEKINTPEELVPDVVKPKLEARVSLKREENDWEAVYDDSGECLDPTLLEELTLTVGKVHISKAKNNYEQYQSKGQALFNGPYDETFGHVVEVFNFPTDFKTNDLLSVFSDYKETGFEIKWVDDNHALIVFSSAKIAAEVMANPHPLVRCRPLHEATMESRNKAKKCAEFLQPYRQRPETCTALARRLVSGALGVRLSTAQQERAEERRLIGIAREKKRQAALHKEAAWDGSLTGQAMDSS